MAMVVRTRAHGSGPGRAGRPIMVNSNTFDISLPTKAFDQYDDITPPPSKMWEIKKQEQAGQENPPRLSLGRREAIEVIEALQTRVAPEFFSPRGSYDGKFNLFLWRSKIGEGKTWKFEHPPNSKRIYEVKLVRVAGIPTSALNNLVSGRKDIHSDIAVTAVNVVVRMAPAQKTGIFYTKRSFFRLDGLKSLGSGLELAEGWYQSVRPAMGRMIINLDTTNAVLYKQGSLIDVCLEFISPSTNRGRINVRDALSGRNLKEKVNKLGIFLRMKKVTLNRGHPLYGKRTKSGRPVQYVIEGFEARGASQYMFSREAGQKQISVSDYFRAHHNAVLQYDSIICARLKNSEHGFIVMPIEYLDMMPGQIYKSRLGPDPARAMIKMTQKKPPERLRGIQDGFRFMDYDGDFVTQSGMAVKSSLMSTRARKLDHPDIQYAGATINAGDGSWNVLNKRLLRPSTIKAWGFVVGDQMFMNNDPNGHWNEFLKPLKSALESLGIRILSDPVIRNLTMGSDVSSTLDSVLHEAINAGKNEAARQGAKNVVIEPHDVLIIVVLNLPSLARDAVKRWGDITQGVPTQIVVGNKAFKRNGQNQYCNNLALKINAKMGGINSTIKNEWFSNTSKPTMIIGADVSHPSPTSPLPSISGIVFTPDYRSCSDYVALSAVQKPRLEVIENFAGMFEYAIRSFDRNVRKTLKDKADPSKKYTPHRVVIYRDGVSEGEFENVYHAEMEAIRKKCQAMDINPMFTFIIVGKRHHMRFFPNDKHEGDDNGNCRAGTVIDSEVVHPLYDDFYLQSQKGLIGTSRSSHYTVLLDENSFTSDSLQRLSFDLCHVFARSTSSVSIPAPVYYADIVCGRSRYHFSEDVYGSEGSQAGEPPVPDGNDDAAREARLAYFKPKYSHVHSNLAKRMYFM